MKSKSLTAIIHEDVKEAPSGLDAYVIADLIGKPYATLMSELGRQPGHKFGADLVLPAMQKTGSDRGMHFLARELGGVFVRLPESQGPLRPTAQQCVAAIKEFSEFIQSIADALEDGRITRPEFEKARKEGYESIRSSMVLLEAMENEVEDCRG